MLLESWVLGGELCGSNDHDHSQSWRGGGSRVACLGEARFSPAFLSWHSLAQERGTWYHKTIVNQLEGTPSAFVRPMDHNSTPLRLNVQKRRNDPNTFILICYRCYRYVRSMDLSSPCRLGQKHMGEGPQG